MRIKHFPKFQLSDINTLSIAISSVGHNQQHIGILYTDEQKSEKLLHLAWYNKLQKDNPSKESLWLDVDLDDIVKITLSAWCETIYQANPSGIPYDINIEGTNFDPQGVFTKETQFAGLTCATFVIQVFNSHGLNIIDFNNWPIRDEDKRWQAKIMRLLLENISILLRNSYVTKKTQEIVLGLQRFRPEEVAVAATLPMLPHGQDSVKAAANRILIFLHSIFPTAKA